MKNNKLIKLIENKNEKITQRCSGVMNNISHPERVNFLRVSSNMKEFYKEPQTNEETTFKRLLFYRELAHFYQFNYDSTHTNFIQGKFPKEPVIYVSYHIGSYRSINHLLHTNNINYCMAISQNVMGSQNADYQQLHNSLINNGTSISDFQVLDAENPSSLFQMIRYVKQGYSLLFYLDGNSGIGGMARNDEKLITVDFFGKKILSRKGIGYLSHFLKIPIVPIVSFFETDNKMSFDILDPIFPTLEQPRELSTITSSQLLWKILESYLERYPEQWEGWLYLDTFKLEKELAENNINVFEKDSLVRFNSDRYDFYKADKFFLFDKATINSYKLQDVLFKFLEALKNNSKGIIMNDLSSLFPSGLLNQLIQTQILI